MMARMTTVLATCVLVILAAGVTYGQLPTAATLGTCYATSGGSTGRLLTVNLTTGAGALIGETGTDGLPGLAIDSHGHLFASDRFDNHLYRLDAATGVATVATNTEFMDDDAGALVFDASDRLIGINSTSDVAAVDTLTGVWSLLSSITSDVKGMAYSNDTLFISTGSFPVGGEVVGPDSVGTLDPDTGTEALIGDITPTDPHGGGTPDLAVDANNVLYGVKNDAPGPNTATSTLYRIDKTTGAGTMVGSGIGYHVSGFACYNGAVEPPDPEGKFLVCHNQGNSGKSKTLEVSAAGREEHLTNHELDSEGACPAGKYSAIPEAFALSQNYPNPFNPTTTISFALPEAAPVRLAVYNAVGQEVKVLVSSMLEAGTHTATWNATDHNGQKVATGLYIYKLTAGNYVATRKMLLLE